MSRFWRVGLRGFGVFVGMFWLAASATATEFAAEGRKGTLNVSVVVEGAGRVENQGGGWDYLEWEVRNTAELRLELTALEPTMNAEKFAGLAGVGADDDEDDGDWEEAWDDKLDACDGDETCENRVEMQRMQDPRFRAEMGGALAVMATMDFDDFGPTLQSWTFVPGTVTGRASLHWKNDTYGVIDTAGGPNVDSHCVTSGQTELTARPTGYGDIGLALTIDSEDSSYELALPIDTVSVPAAEDCGTGPGAPGERHILGGVAGEGTWGEVLTVRGLLSGNSGQLSLGGTKEWEGEWSEGGKTRVTATWSFAP